MNDLIINKLDEITSLIDKDDDLIELKRLENNIILKSRKSKPI